MNKAVPRLILASASAARQTMLRGCGLRFEVCPASLDEEGLIRGMQGQNPENSARILAREKALSISHQKPGAVVIGADQILELDGNLVHKARNKDEAREKLKMLQGKTHHLFSAAAVAQDGAVLAEFCARADMTMHVLDDGFIERYIDSAGEVLTSCVGAYAIEAHGAWLFSAIRGEYHVILGMPLVSLLTFLRTDMGFGP